MKKRMVCFLLLGVFALGLSGCAKTVSLEEYESLNVQYGSLEADRDTLVEEKSGQAESLEAFQEIEEKYDELKTITADFIGLSEEQRVIAIEAAKKEDELAVLESKKAELEGQAEGLQQTIDGLNADIIRIKGEAKTFPAGHLNAGTDFELGRYKIYGGSSNFVVYSSSNRLQVNIILGGRYGVEEYIYTFSSGDQIKASSSFKMVPVE